ncbi:lipopolysaccharide transport periplasmic protein LptA [Acidovorax sp. BL-A-41-H1]|uniref:lipopolysaccharide transport periplasmic protein LptA n=1 Tax=Acidovorax sp. BL-A-41-H1 TaxID=3421102 RepID=UPI003F7A634D
MNHRLLPILLLTALASFHGAVQAEKADRAKPMNIEADALRHDELKQTSVFTGRVVMTKGSIVLRGARLDVRQDAEGYQYGVVTAEPGKRAFFRQKRDTAPGAPDEFIEGESETIEYDGKSDNVRFITRAELRRYRGSALSDEITGAVIVYNNLTDVFTVDGQRTTPGGQAAGASAGQSGRVRAVLAPKEPAPAAGGASAPAAPAASGPALRPSNSLSGGAK